LEGFHVSRVNVGELAEGALFAVEKLQHHHSGNGFLQIGIDTRDCHSDSAVGISHLYPENHCGPENERDDREGDQRQLPVHAQHDGQYADQHKDVLEDGDHPGSEHLVDGINIGGNTGDQPAHGVLVIEADVHTLQMTKDLAAQVEHDFLACPLHEVDL